MPVESPDDTQTVSPNPESNFTAELAELQSWTCLQMVPCLHRADPDLRMASFSVVAAAPFSLDYTPESFVPLRLWLLCDMEQQ